MLWLWILLLVAALIAALLLLPLRLRLTYTADEGLALRLNAAFLSFALYPEKEESPAQYLRRMKKEEEKKRREEKKKQKAAAKKARTEKTKKEEDRKRGKKKKRKLGDTLVLVRQLLRIAGIFVRKFAPRLRVRIREFVIVTASDDAARTAVLYGTTAQLVSVLFGLLGQCRVFELPEGDKLNVGVDFLYEQFTARVDIEMSIRIGGLLASAFTPALRLLSLFAG